MIIPDNQCDFGWLSKNEGDSWLAVEQKWLVIGCREQWELAAKQLWLMIIPDDQCD